MPDAKGGIELADDIEFQRRSWRVQRIGWIAMLIIAIAALLGLFGDGLLSSAESGDAASGLRVRYDRFTRNAAQHSVDLEAGPQANVRDSVKIWVARDWLDSNRLIGMTPEPARSDLLPDRIVFTFNATQAGRPVAFRFELEARWMGRRTGRAGIVNGPTVEFRQFAYP